jgi:putative zinc finger protein
MALARPIRKEKGHMQHLDEGTIHAWLDGELPPDEAESAARHVAGCAECRALVVEARGLLAGASRIVSALDAGPAGVIPAAQRGPTSMRRPWYRLAFTPVRVSIAATIIVAAGLTLTARHAADNSALRRRLIDSQINTGAPAMSATAIADSASTKPVDQATSKLKAVPNAPALIATPTTAMPSSKPGVSAASRVSEAAGFESKTLQADKQAVANSPRQLAASTPDRAEAAPPAARLDTARAKDEMAKVAADSLRRAPAPERRQAAFAAGNANQVRGIVAAERDADRSSSVLVLRDCYRLAVDSTDWRGVLPSGLALDARASGLGSAARATAFAAGAAGGGAGRGGTGVVSGGAQPTNTTLPAASPARNTVHALDSNGHVGAVVIGLWFLGHADTIGVRLSTPDAKVVTLLLTDGSSNARVISGDRTDSVRVARTSCPR